MPGLIFVILAPIFLFIFNALTNELCAKKSIPAESQPNVFRTINVLITLLLISAYVENIFTY
ncbi:hypothetical protein SAMN04488137_4235 [Fictibacillus solisalsi]|uniref:Uncharacterized protein n=1 Tax=Fictibacillus solisalsi TaxID=459525 RepID=A0A1H0AVV9_9BACL|nr:hypothetical protein [Fictibacillus solisalsi]SDN37346.1 hypothetical protein SAMN04488137_4235 [Fictibacillus solisalsi]